MPPRVPTRKPSKGSIKPLDARKPVSRRSPRSEPAGGLQGRIRTTDLGLFDRRKPVFVGIDQSLTAFGLAAYAPEDGTAFLWLFEPKSRGVNRLLDIQGFVHQTLNEISLRCKPPEHVVMEGYAYSRQMGHALGECGAVTKLALIRAMGVTNKVAYPTIPTSQQVKKFTTSKGNAKKDDMKLAVYKKWGVEVSDENLADAYSMARMAAAIEVPDHMDYEYERQVIGALERHTEWPHQLEQKRSTNSSRRAKRASSG